MVKKWGSSHLRTPPITAVPSFLWHQVFPLAADKGYVFCSFIFLSSDNAFRNWGVYSTPRQRKASSMNCAPMQIFNDLPSFNPVSHYNNINLCSHNSTASFAFYAPKLYMEYHNTQNELYNSGDCLEQNFQESVFPASTFNLGPNTVTLDHIDYANVAYDLCCISALGNYNPDKGGHMILFDLGLMIRFPSGSTILIPSSVLRHGNTPIATQETCMSFTQYCAGGLFCWVQYGFQMQKDLLKQEGGAALKEVIDQEWAERCNHGISLFSKVSELADDCRKAFSWGGPL